MRRVERLPPLLAAGEKWQMECNFCQRVMVFLFGFLLGVGTGTWWQLCQLCLGVLKVRWVSQARSLACLHPSSLLLLDSQSTWYIYSFLHPFTFFTTTWSVCIHLPLLLLGMHSTWYIHYCTFFSNQQWKLFASIFPCSCWTCIQHGTYTLVPSFVTHKQFLFASIFSCPCWACIQHGTSALVPSFLTSNGKCLHPSSFALVGHAFNMVHLLLCLLF